MGTPISKPNTNSKPNTVATPMGDTIESLQTASLEQAEAYLTDVVRLVDFVGATKWATDLWPTQNSLRWFLRKHGEELVVRRAIFKHSTDWFIRKERFTLEVAAIVRASQA